MGDIAAVIVEPLPANYGLLPQRPEWLAHLAERCRRAGALLVLDEVISGFPRRASPARRELFGIRPDLVCYGKVIGGGFPVGAYGGRADLMDLVAPVGPVYQAGTLSANPVGMRAGLATLAKMVDRDGWGALERTTADFTADVSSRLATVAPDVDVVRHASIFWIRRRRGRRRAPARSHPGANAAWYARFFHARARARRLSAAVGLRSLLPVDGARRGDAGPGADALVAAAAGGRRDVNDRDRSRLHVRRRDRLARCSRCRWRPGGVSARSGLQLDALAPQTRTRACSAHARWEGASFIGLLARRRRGAARQRSGASSAAAARSKRSSWRSRTTSRRRSRSLQLQAESLREDWPEAAARNPNSIGC